MGAVFFWGEPKRDPNFKELPKLNPQSTLIEDKVL